MAARFDQSVADRAELLWRSHSLRTVSAILGISQNTIINMKRNGWKPRDNSCQLRPMPSDFAIMNARISNIHDLMAHYRCGCRPVQRWRRELRARG